MPSFKLPSLSVFLPCYNEALNIPLLIQDLEEVLPTVARTYEILILNDGSQDETKKVAQHLATKNSKIRVVSHQENRGYGATLRTGFKAAKYEWLFFTDGDRQFNVGQIKKLIPFTKQYHVIIGYRTRRADGKLRALNAFLFKLYIDLLFRIGVKDIDCAFKLIKTECMQSLPLQSTGAFTSAEFLYRLKKKGEKFKQVAVNHYPRKFGKPTGNSPRVIIKAGLEALQVYLRTKFTKAR